jgi:phosphatidylinositol 4-kinase type 2
MAQNIFSLQSIPSIYLLDPGLKDDYNPVPTDSLVPPPAINTKAIIPPVTPVASKDFVNIIKEVENAISLGIYPVLVTKGSSGAYFCKDSSNEIVGIFKPKDEEPYGRLNPKWTKWLHRNLFPCCFGRSCIIPNSGYLSEAAASFFDRRLGLGIVPRTEIVTLSSPSFNYKASQKWSNRLFGTPLPKKIGSFQLFLKGFVDSTTFFQDGFQKLEGTQDQPHPLGWDQNSMNEFQAGFERLVILDYLIRNTDRGSDNWMIKVSSNSQSTSNTVINESNIETPESEPVSFESPHVQIGAIDNGLAFPTKHPNQIRSYPYGWIILPIVHHPFSSATTNQFLPYLTSTIWWEGTLNGIQTIFSIDDDFKPKMWTKQKAVIRGQAYNLLEVLSTARTGQISPFDLVKKHLVLVHERQESVILEEDEESQALLSSSEYHESLDPVSKQKRNFKKVRVRVAALFRRC